MSPRIKTIRKVLNPPTIKGFKPYGPESFAQDMEPVNLLFEEYEALRLSDYDMLNHHQASVMMQVSRPTFTRIYASALQKIAKAFVEGRQISISGGKVYFDSDWYRCHGCHCYFNNPHKNEAIVNCPLCGDRQFTSFDYDNMNLEDKTLYNDDFFVCPHCGFEVKNQAGIPLNQQTCPDCNSLMN